MSAGGGIDQARLRAWLEYVVETAIEMLDAMDAAMTDREPDHDDEVVSEDDGAVRRRAA